MSSYPFAPLGISLEKYIHKIRKPCYISLAPKLSAIRGDPLIYYEYVYITFYKQPGLLEDTLPQQEHVQEVAA